MLHVIGPNPIQSMDESNPWTSVIQTENFPSINNLVQLRRHLTGYYRFNFYVNVQLVTIL